MKARREPNWATVQTDNGWVGMPLSQLRPYLRWGNNNNRAIAIFYYYRESFF